MAHKKKRTMRKSKGTKLKECPKCGKQIPVNWTHHQECVWEQGEGTEGNQVVGKAKIEIFTSPTCPHCSAALKQVRELSKQRDDVRLVESSTGMGSGRRRAQQLGVMSVPTVFVSGPAYPQLIGFKGAPSREGLEKAIDIALGRAAWEKKKGLVNRMLEKLNIRIR